MALLGASGSGDAALAATACDCSQLALMASRRLAMLHWPRNELAITNQGELAAKEGLPASRFGRLLDLYALSEDYSHRWAKADYASGLHPAQNSAKTSALHRASKAAEA